MHVCTFSEKHMTLCQHTDVQLHVHVYQPLHIHLCICELFGTEKKQ